MLSVIFELLYNTQLVCFNILFTIVYTYACGQVFWLYTLQNMWSHTHWCHIRESHNPTKDGIRSPLWLNKSYYLLDICKFATSPAGWVYHSTSQPACESPSTSWCILPADRSVPADKFQQPWTFFNVWVKWAEILWGCVGRRLEWCHCAGTGSLNFIIQFSVPLIKYPLGGRSKKGSHVYFLLQVFWVMLLFCQIVLLSDINVVLMSQ